MRTLIDGDRLAAMLSRLTGSLTEATIRFPSALYATLGVLILFILGQRIFDVKTALLGAAILATMMVYQDQALSARVDMTLCFFVTSEVALFYLLYCAVLFVNHDPSVQAQAFFLIDMFATLPL